MSTGTAVAPSQNGNGEKKPSQLTTIKGALESPQFKEAIARALPKHMTAERFLRIAVTATLRTPKLMQCTQTSLLNCLLQLSQYGLEPDGRHAHLIPYGTDCTLIIDYKGLVALVLRSGLVSTLHADVICENDDFEYDKGFIVRHKIDFKQPRGKVYAVYCVCRLKDGTEKSEVMTRDDVEAIRSRSKAGRSGPWVTDWNEMAKKTAFRRLSKWLPLSPEIRDAMDGDDDRLAESLPSNVIPGTAIRTDQSKSDQLAEMLASRGGNDLDTAGEESNDNPGSGEESQEQPEGLTQATIIERLKARIEVAMDLDTLKEIDAAAGAIEDDDTRQNIYARAGKRREEVKKMQGSTEGKLPGT
jgi:recombination protein RecT